MTLASIASIRATARICKGHGPRDFITGSGHTIKMEEPDLDDIILRLDARLKELGLSDREASLRATGKPDAIRELRRKKRPSDMRLRQLAEAIDMDVDDLRGGLDWATQAMVDQTSLVSQAMRNRLSGLPRDVPVYAPLALDPFRNRGPFEVSFEKPIRFACRPPILNGREDVFVIAMPDLTMRPRFDLGDELYIDPRSAIGEGDDVLIRFEHPGTAAPASRWQVTIRRLLRVQDDGIAVEKFNPALSEVLSIDQIWTVLRIIPYPELLSY